VFRSKTYRDEILSYIGVQHCLIQKMAVSGLEFGFPSVLMALVIVDQKNKVKEVQFSCSPWGSQRTRKSIREHRKQLFRA
jgi:hypothetical protein